jgi:hypothetical protein
VQLMWKCVEIVLHFLRYIFKNLASSTWVAHFWATL